MDYETQYGRILRHLRRSQSTHSELASLIGASDHTVSRILYDMVENGVNLHVSDSDRYYIADCLTDTETYLISPSSPEYKEGRFMIISDTHLNSKHHDSDILQSAYQRILYEHIDVVFHIGDWQEGTGRMYHGQLNELVVFGIDELLEYMDRHIPDLPLDTTIYGIGGNHDESWVKLSGGDVIRTFANKYPSKRIKYLGMNVGDVVLDGLHIRLLHGDGGGSYARSYPSQKYIRNLMPDDRPDILLVGHYHTYIHMNEQGVEVIQAPSMQRSTNWLLRKGIQSQTGYVVVEYGVKDGKLQWVSPRVYWH